MKNSILKVRKNFRSKLIGSVVCLEPFRLSCVVSESESPSMIFLRCQVDFSVLFMCSLFNFVIKFLHTPDRLFVYFSTSYNN